MYRTKFRRFLILILIVSWGIVFFNLRLSTKQNHQLYKDTYVMMGTFVKVTSPDKKAKDIVFAEIRRIENLLSKYKADSEVSKLNEMSGNFPTFHPEDPEQSEGDEGSYKSLRVSPETYSIIKKAKEFWLISDGAFDITVGPLLDLWGWTDKQFTVPKEQDIKNILTKIGSDKIILNKKDTVVKFMVPGMKIDLGAIAKGFAVDCAVDKLRKAGIKNCLINAGGDIYCLGDKLGKPWEVAIQNPRAKGTLERLLLKDQAVATSGNYEQFFLKDKARYSHIFDPRTGKPSDSGLASVTVIAADCLTADALATSIFVLGKVKGEELVKKFSDVKIIVIEE